METIEGEEWKKVEFSFAYYISNLGRIMRGKHKVWNSHNNCYLERYGGLLIPSNNNSKGYYRIKIKYHDESSRFESIHRLVAKAFILNPDNLPQVNHKDGDKANNKVENLEWCTNQQNIEHKHLVLNKFNYFSGEKCNFSKLTEEKVKQIPIMLNEGKTQKFIADYFQVAPTTITEIVRGRSWNYLKLFPSRNKKSLKYLDYSKI